MAKKSEAVAPHQASSEFLYPLIQIYKGKHKGYGQNKQADAMGISRSKVSNYVNGHDLPSPEDCLIMAHFYAFPVEELLQLCGYPTVRDLVAFAETLSPKTEAGEYEKEFMLEFLRLSLEPEWQLLDWSSPWRATAEMNLARSTDRYTKAYSYATQVYGWDLEKRHSKHTHIKSQEFASLAQVS